MLYLKQSTASQSVLLGPFVDDTDGATAETGLTIANTDIKISKNGGTIANKTSGGGTHDANGWYAITLDATDTNTVGRLQISCKVAGALAVWMECQVLEEAIYDALFAASAAGYAGISELATVDTVVDAIKVKTDFLPSATAGAAGGVFIAGTNAATTITTALTTTFTGNLTGSVGSVSGSVGSVAGNVDGSVGSIAGVTFPSNFADLSISVTTGYVSINEDGSSYTAIPWNAAWDAEVQSEVNDGLVAFWTSPATLVDLVWDEVLTGATHNVATSAGRRLRSVQDNQAYDDGAIWIDTINGTAGTTVYENGTAGLPVSTIADAITLAAAANVKHLHIVNGSTITLAATMDNYELTGDEWGLAFGGQSCNSLSVHNAHLSGVGVTGTFTGNPHILHSTIGAITGPNARIGWCALTGTVTSNGTGTWVIHSCWGLSGAQIDFGAGGAQTIYVTDWVGGPITIANMATGDVLYFEGRSAVLTLAASCTGGTVFLVGDIALTNSGSGQTINQTSRYEITRILSDTTAFQGADIAAILGDTNELQTDWANGGRLDLLLDAVSTHSAADVWTSGTRTLTAATNITSDGSAINVTAGVVDTVTTLTNLPAITSNWLTAAGIAASALNGKGDWATQANVATEISDALTVDTLVAGVTIVEAIRRTGAVVCYKLSGAGTGTETVTDWADSASTIVFTVDGSGNKTAVTFN